MAESNVTLIDVDEIRANSAAAAAEQKSAPPENTLPDVEIIDDTPEADRGRKPLNREVPDPGDEELESYSEGIRKRINDLTHARHDERRRADAVAREKQELERLAQALLNENNNLKQYVNQGEQQYAATLQVAVGGEIEAAKRKLKEAHEAFDNDAIVEAQAALTAAMMRKQQADNFRPTPLPPAQNVVQTQQPAPQTVPLDDKTADWQSRNQWFGAPGYEEITSFSLGLHQKLVNSGVDPRSDEYFERIDARLKSTFPDVFTTEEKRSSDAPRKPSTVVAPAGRSTGARKIQLTATQVGIAKRLGLTPQQYAVEMAKLEKSNG